MKDFDYYASQIMCNVLFIISTLALYISLRKIMRYTRELAIDGLKSSKLIMNSQTLSLAIGTIMSFVILIFATIEKVNHKSTTKIDISFNILTTIHYLPQSMFTILMLYNFTKYGKPIEA